MSEEIQKRARDRRDAAEQRENSARERAELNREHGDPMLGRLHERNAELHAATAEAAERRRLADVELEGEQLGEPIEPVGNETQPNSGEHHDRSQA
jgi:hypothetical protein